ncbi:type II secretion system F family protein [Mesobacillus boroniphilus]|nr:type II secretion system F family protein [Mesobacillus boroniphilus]
MNLRLKEFLPAAFEEEAIEQAAPKESLLKRLVLKGGRILRNVQFSKRTEKTLLEAGSQLKPEEYFIIRVLSGAAAGLGFFMIGLQWFFCFPAAAVGFMLPRLYMKQKRKKRLQRISYQLIEILGMMANSMRAGYSFMQAMQQVGKEIPDPLGPEFERVIRQAGLGISLDEVFEEVMVRLPNKELEVVIRAIMAQRKSGGNLAGLMETMEDTVRGRIRIMEELNTLTSQGRMSSWIITLLPVGLAFYLAFFGQDYFQPMLEHPLGWLMLSSAGINILIGWFFIQKIIKIEV